MVGLVGEDLGGEEKRFGWVRGRILGFIKGAVFGGANDFLHFY